MSAPVSRSALAILGAEVTALVPEARGARSRLAARIRYSNAAVSNVMLGTARPSWELVVRLAEALGVDAPTRARWLALAGHPAEEPPCDAPDFCAARGCDCAVSGTRDPGHPFRALCDRCRCAARRRMIAGKIDAATAAAQLVAEGKRGKAFRCGWCDRSGAAGRALFERAPGGGMQCREGYGCAARRRRAA